MGIPHDRIPSPVEITQALVQIETTTDTSGEFAGLQYVAGLFAHRTDLVLTTPLRDNGEWSALLISPAHVTGPLLVLSGHIDTVPVTEPEQWQHPPLGAFIDDEGWLWGRGASDMKSGLAALIHAVLVSEPGAPVALAVSRLEEVGCQGTVDVVAALQQANVEVGALIVAEPTAGRVVTGHKGPLWLRIETAGVAAHGSTPERGVNAITAMSRLLLRAGEELPRRSHPVLGTETLNIGVITGGTLRNIVPDSCRAEIDIRTVDADVTPLIEWWTGQPERPQVTTIVHSPSLSTDPGDTWVGSLSGELADEPVGFGTEAGPLAHELGLTRAVVWGPGPLDRMHTRDERVAVSAIERAAEGYAAAITNWESFRHTV